MNNIITGFSIVQDPAGTKIAYVFSAIDSDGNILESNKRGSYIVVNENIKEAIETIKTDIQPRLK